MTLNYFNNAFLATAINNYLINNSIQVQKLLFTGDGQKYLRDDGIFASSLYVPWNGTLAGINAKLLIIT